MAIAEWESYVLSGRFKTKRQRKRLLIEGRDKRLFHLYHEFLAVRKEQRELGYTELNPPVQKGWKRFFVLRSDVEMSRDAVFFSDLLQKINTTNYSHRKDFKRKRKRRGKKVYVDKPQHLRWFYDYELNRMKLTEREMSFFKSELEFIGHSTRTCNKYVFTEPWRFVLQIKPNMITKVKIIDPILKSRETEIDSYLEGNKLYPRLLRKMTGSYYRGWARFNWRPEDREQKKLRTHDVLNNINNEKNE